MLYVIKLRTLIKMVRYVSTGCQFCIILICINLVLTSFPSFPEKLIQSYPFCMQAILFIAYKNYCFLVLGNDIEIRRLDWEGS